eukprot:46791-Pelagomonas_calceolata.AAC.5
MHSRSRHIATVDVGAHCMPERDYALPEVVDPTVTLQLSSLLVLARYHGQVKAADCVLDPWRSKDSA